MTVPGAKAALTTPGAASALYVATSAWIIAGLLFGVILWPNESGLDGPAGTADRGAAMIVFAICMFAATVSYASGAILQRMATWQAAEVEVQ